MNDFEARVIAAARDWTAECLTEAQPFDADGPVRAEQITPERAMRFVARFYGGGVAIFRRDVEVGGF